MVAQTDTAGALLHLLRKTGPLLMTDIRAALLAGGHDDQDIREVLWLLVEQQRIKFRDDRRFMPV